MSSASSALPPVWQHNGVEIRFPFSPYPSQKAFTENVLECVVNGKHGILESPTGTGKTMALLAAAVAWTEHRRRIPMATSVMATSMSSIPVAATSLASVRGSSLVIYASRTHSQLVQVMAQLKRCLNSSPAASSVKAVVLGSRDQLCINPKAADKESSEKVKLCNVLTRARQCEFYNNFQVVSTDQMSSRSSDLTEDICDIEDLVQKSRQRKICPYYASRDIASRADLVFLPYNYLLDASVRASLAIDLRDSVIIFDEAHNIMSTCEDATSYSFEVQDVALALHETDVIIQFLDSKIDIDFGGKESAEVQVEDACLVKEALANLEDVLAAKIRAGDVKCDQAYPGDAVLELLTASGIDFSRQLWLRTVMTNMTDLLAVLNSMTGGRESGKGLNSLCKVIQFVYSESSVEWTREHLRSYFRMYVERSTRHKDNVIFNVWCFNPAYAMRSLLSCGVRSMILTSGTLKPMSAIKTELGVNFDVTFVGPHVIGQSQVCAWTVPKAQDGTDLISTYENRSRAPYLDSLGRSLTELANLVPDGMLVFFPSYAVMESCVEHWKQSAVWNSLTSAKAAFVEPRQKHAFQVMMVEFRRAIASASGACLMAVCRGKLAEGIDFTDRMARAVVLTGIPYPNLYDARVRLKREYMDAQKNGLSGGEWYRLEAYRAINQAVGRVVRHQNDFGSVLFLDKRFAEAGVKAELSDWILPTLKTGKISDVTASLREFYRRNAGLVGSSVGAGLQRSSVSQQHQPVSGVRRGAAVSACSGGACGSSAGGPPKKAKKIVIAQPAADSVLMYRVTNVVSRLKARLNKVELGQFKDCLKGYKEGSNLEMLLSFFESLQKENKLQDEDLLELQGFIKAEDIQRYESWLQ